MVNKGLIRPYFWGGTLGGGWLISHKRCFAIFLKVTSSPPEIAGLVIRAYFRGSSVRGLGGAPVDLIVKPSKIANMTTLRRCTSY